jgi:hypothetical protein
MWLSVRVVKACSFFVALALLTGAVHGSGLLREEGAIYLEDLMDKPLRLTVLQQTPIYYDAALDRYLGTLRPMQSVELQAVLPNTYRIKGRAQQGQVAGWVDPSALTALDKEFVKKLRQAADRKKQIDALVAANEVAIHMTPAEVTLSLGKPQKKTSRTDEKGHSEVWEYVRYVRVPQQVTGRDRFGGIVSETVYVKVPAGRLSVIFTEGLVSALEQSEGALSGRRAKIVTTPFFIE